MKLISRVSSVDTSKCVGCGSCEKHCPTGAIKVKRGVGSTPYVSPCQSTCPAGVHVPGYVALAAQGEYEAAYRLIRRDNPFPSVCGRICTHPCQEQCNRGSYDAPVAIRDIKRFVADWAFNHTVRPEMGWSPNGKKVAIIGAGPSGLTCGYYLALSGCEVHVYDSAPVAGGVLAFGIPEYRLPRDVLSREVAVIEQAGVQIHLNTEVGKDIAFDTLKQENDAVYIATGTQFSKTANIPGEDMDGVYHGLDFLREVHLGHGPDVTGKRVVVVGGGNTAIDAARTAIRGKAQSVTILYRRREIDMPADPREVLEAKEEGIQLAVLAAPLAFTGDGKVENIRCIRMELGEKGSDGRRTTHPVEGDEFDLAADAVIVAVSQYSDFPFIGKDEVEMSEWGELKVNEKLMTTMDGVFAGGDVMRGSDTAITAIADGKHAAQYISDYLGLAAGINQGAEIALPDKDGHVWNRDNVSKMPCLAPETRVCSQAEVALGLSEEQTKAESERCYRCSGRATVDPARCIDCQLCWEHCAHDAITMQPLEQDVMRMHPGIRLDQLDDYLEVCKKAHIMPDELICNCTFTMASEIVGAIFDGAHTMEDVSVATAVRGGCGIYCSQAILRLLESAGYPQTVRNDGGWYKIDVNLWNIPEEVLDKDPCLQLRKHQQNLWSDELFAQHAEAFKKSLEAKQQ